MRRVDYMGSKPFASTLLFAPPVSDSEDDSDGILDLDEAPSPPSGFDRQSLDRGGPNAEKREEQAPLGESLS